MQNDLGAILFLLFVIVIYFCASAYGITKCRMNNLIKESGKPIIRHCRNCEYGELYFCGDIHCTVLYKFYDRWKQRRKALFCKYYKAKEGGDNER